MDKDLKIGIRRVPQMIWKYLHCIAGASYNFTTDFSFFVLLLISLLIKCPILTWKHLTSMSPMYKNQEIRLKEITTNILSYTHHHYHPILTSFTPTSTNEPPPIQLLRILLITSTSSRLIKRARKSETRSFLRMKFFYFSLSLSFIHKQVSTFLGPTHSIFELHSLTI